MSADDRFDPRALLELLDRARIDYVVVGGVARVLRGSAELTESLDVVPSLNERGRVRLAKLLDELGQRVEIGAAPIELGTAHGALRIVPTPWGTNGYEDLRRNAGREHLGGTVRPQIASVVDLARMLEASPRNEDADRLKRLRRMTEIERQLGQQRSLGVDR